MTGYALAAQPNLEEMTSSWERRSSLRFPSLKSHLVQSDSLSSLLRADFVYSAMQLMALDVIIMDSGVRQEAVS